ncbi:MAG TPA: hypothetical protein VJB65_00675 [Patescibacteria group bacterium]|nr:hypothetical protein [Patescibacteria group bacterium]
MPQKPQPKPLPTSTPPSSNIPTKDDVKIPLDSAAGVQTVRESIDEAIADGDKRDVIHIIRKIEKLVQSKQPDFQEKKKDLYTQLQRHLARGKWFVLDALNSTDLEPLFSEQFDFFFTYHWKDILEQIKTILFASVPIDKERDPIKKKLRLALARSQAVIGEQAIRVVEESVAPTVANWLRDWREFTLDKKLDALQIVEYLNKSENVRVLSKEDKEKVEAVLKFDYALSFSSMTAEGTEISGEIGDPISGTFKYFKNGEVVNTGVAIPQESLEFMRYMYGLDKNGKPLTPAQIVRSSVRYQKPVVLSENTKQPAAKEPVPMPEEQKNATIKQDLPQIPPAPVPVLPKKSQQVVQVPRPILSVPQPPKPSSKPEFVAPPKSIPKIETPAPSVKKPVSTGIDYSLIARQVLNVHKLLFPTLDIEKRFMSIVSSYSKGIHTSKTARELLTLPVEEGGVHLPVEQVDSLLKTANELLVQAKKHPSAFHRIAQQKSASNSFTPTLQSMQHQMTLKKKQEQQASEETIAKTGPAPVEDIFANENASSIDITVPRFAKTHTAESMRHQKPPFMTDIVMNNKIAKQQTQPLVMGPIDELHNMNILEFRRLAPVSQEAVKKIVQKMNLLEQESVVKKAEGIDAWYNSPLNQLYLRIGNLSLEKTISVREAIAHMQQNNQETMTEEEFQAIADLNKQIRY